MITWLIKQPGPLATMDNTFLRHQLRALHCLKDDSTELFFRAFKKEPPRQRGQILIDEGSEAHKAYVIADGWAVRYKTLADGRRQILNFQVPGDLIGYFALLFGRVSFTVEPLTPITLQSFTPQRAFDTFRQAPELAVALSWLAAQAERQLDEQLVRVGRRRAKERMAHLFMELNYRLLRAGTPAGVARCLPLSQPLLADALGMSHIHAHRTFRALVCDGLVLLEDGQIKLQDTDELSRVAGFDASYLAQGPLPPSASAAFSK